MRQLECFTSVLVVIDPRNADIQALSALACLLDEPAPGCAVGVARVDDDHTRLQAVEKDVPAVEHCGEERDHGIAPLEVTKFRSMPFTVIGESTCDSGRITTGGGVRVAVDEAADLLLVGDGGHSGSPSIRRVICLSCARRVSPSTSASSGCITATLIALDSIAACRRASTPASVPSNAAYSRSMNR